MAISASQLYDCVACPHKVHLDLYGDGAGRDPVSPFVQLLWDRGTSFEADVVADLSPDAFSSLRDTHNERRGEATLQAMRERVPMIYGGRLILDDMVGEPDLLILNGATYMAADIKAGRGEEGDSDEGDGRPKAHYAVQLAFYSDLLERIGFGTGHVGEIWDVNGDRVHYDLDRPRHSRTTETWWEQYQQVLADVRAITDRSIETRGALASICKLCQWGTSCREELSATFDLSLIPGLGRSRRDAMAGHFATLHDFSTANPEALVVGRKTAIPGVGPDTLRLFHARATLLCHPDPKPYLRAEIDLPENPNEIFFDIEADPMSDIVYLHGFIERIDGVEQPFTFFFADGGDLEAERRAFEELMGWLRARPHAAIYYYSKYERTAYRKLCERHPGVTSAGEIEDLFTPPRAIDLYYDVVFRATEWPTNDHSIKSLAKYLGFAWRDADPSGASSIEWYRRLIETSAPDLRQRIIDYNEDDCRATAVLLDGIRALKYDG